MRSECSVRVGAVLADKYGVISWSWNHVGFDGFGAHAEPEAIRRSNRKRLAKATMYIAAVRRKSGNILTARPCPDCQKAIKKVGRVIYRDGSGDWVEFKRGL